MFIDPSKELVLYARLSQAYKSRRQMQDRDRALVMSGVCASMLNMAPIAKFCRQLIMQNNRGHMMKRYESFDAALKDEDFYAFLKQVRKKIPADKVPAIVEQLGYRCPVRKKDFTVPEAYIASVLGVDFPWLMENFSE